MRYFTSEWKRNDLGTIYGREEATMIYHGNQMGIPKSHVLATAKPPFQIHLKSQFRSGISQPYPLSSICFKTFCHMFPNFVRCFHVTGGNPSFLITQWDSHPQVARACNPGEQRRVAGAGVGCDFSRRVFMEPYIIIHIYIHIHTYTYIQTYRHTYIHTYIYILCTVYTRHPVVCWGSVFLVISLLFA